MNCRLCQKPVIRPEVVGGLELCLEHAQKLEELLRLADVDTEFDEIWQGLCRNLRAIPEAQA